MSRMWGMGLLVPFVLLGCGPEARSPSSARLEPADAVAQLTRVLAEIQDNYVEPVALDKLMEGAFHGMVSELDPHSSYMTRDEYSSFENDTEGTLVGIGVEVDLRGEALTVIVPIEGGPAEAAGIKSGDRIVALDGQELEPVPLDKVVQRMRGEPGSKVRVTVRRPGTEAPLSFDLTRARIHLTAVSGRLLDSGVMYLRIKQFQQGAASEFENVVAALRKQAGSGVRGAILDLRANPGGLVHEASKIASEFIESGVIYTTRRRDEVIDRVDAEPGGELLRMPLVVLVDQWSASASELLAGALQDHHRARIVGARTFGKGSVQAIIPLLGGAGLRMTIARYYTPNGRSVQSEGILPDVAVAPVASANGVRIVRESDLEGHLAGTRELDAGVRSGRTFDAPLVEPARIDVKGMPADPRKGTDVPLRTAYELLVNSATSVKL